jgi:hypothetical protein
MGHKGLVIKRPTCIECLRVRNDYISCSIIICCLMNLEENVYGKSLRVNRLLLCEMSFFVRSVAA